MGVPSPSGFDYDERENGDVVVRRHGQPVTVLHGDQASGFLDDLALGADAQELMAAITGYDRREDDEARRKEERSKTPGRPAKRVFPKKGMGFSKENSRTWRPR